MQPVKLVIEGGYYDSQIYSGRLYLWTLDGSLETYDWDALIKSINISKSLNLAMSCAFTKSDYLYGTHWHEIFNDEDIRMLLVEKFQALSEIELFFSREAIRQFLVGEQTNLFSFPHSDCTIYDNRMLVSSISGLEMASSGPKLKNPISRKKYTLTDIPVLSFSVRSYMLSLASGSEGLYDYNLVAGINWRGAPNIRSLSSPNKSPRMISSEFTSSARWLYNSIVTTSVNGKSIFAEYENPPRHSYGSSYISSELSDYWMNRPIDRVRDLNTLLNINEVSTQSDGIRSPSITWGARDKICHIANNRLNIYKYSPFEDEVLTEIGQLPFDLSGNGIVNAESATFGYIIEDDTGLTVTTSDSSIYRIASEPVNWRVFIRSKFYSNQLHVHNENELIVYSFNDDYFQDQDSKIIGLRNMPTISQYKSTGQEYL